MKLLHVFETFGLGQAQARLIEIARAAGGRLKHEIISFEDDLKAADLMPEGTMTSVCRMREGKPVEMDLRRLILGAGGDILCTYGSAALAVEVVNAGEIRAPHIHYTDSLAPGAPRVYVRRLRGIASMGGAVIAPSMTEAKMARELWDVPARHIADGVDISRFAPASARAGEGELVTLGLFGGLDKGIEAEEIVRRYGALRTRVSSRLFVFGEGPARPKIENVVLEIGARQKVIFRGDFEDLADALGDIDVAILCEQERQTPDFLAEAMAAGLAVTGFLGGDAPSMVSAENAPFIVDPAETKPLGGALSRLINEAPLREALGATNAAKARAEFSLEKMVKGHLALIREIARNNLEKSLVRRGRA
jgi:glycosyltransferase involved in cell wall biosynthesis